jgi:hypothetical protein
MDAKAWYSEDTRRWYGIHDACREHHSAVGLVEVLQILERCENAGHAMRWEIRNRQNGMMELIGWCA